MNEIIRIFEAYDSRIRPHIDKTLNITGSVSIHSETPLYMGHTVWASMADRYNNGSTVRISIEYRKCHIRNWLKANIYVGSISKLNQEDMRYDMDVFFRQFWNDPRLNLSAFTDKTTTGKAILDCVQWQELCVMRKSYFSVDEKLINSLWVPDLFFANGVGSSRHHVVRRNALLSQVFNFVIHTIWVISYHIWINMIIIIWLIL